MSSDNVAIIGAGLGGLAVAVQLAEHGYRVSCYDDGRPGASLANFGQLHSGAVYAPVLPDVAAACWEYRSRWFSLIDDIDDARHGIGLFSAEVHAFRYLDAWRHLRIPAFQLTTRQATAALGPVKPAIAAAYALPDITVDTATLRARLTARAAMLGVRIHMPAPCMLRLDGCHAAAEVGGRPVSSDLVIVCAGAATPSILDQAHIKHSLAVSHLSYGHIAGEYRLPLTYWLDEDLLALSPTAGGVNVALPGRSPIAGGSNAERKHLANSVARHWPTLAADELVMRHGTVTELHGNGPDPTAQVIDLRAQQTDWSRVDNLLVCLPGKWTTAWKAADHVAALLNASG